MIKPLSISSLLLISIYSSSVFADTLTVKISGIQPNSGNVLIGVFSNAKQFPEGEPTQKALLKGIASSAQTSFNLPKGKYAVGVFQDRNNNELLDKNFFGIPKEQYGFSGRPVFGKPNFNDAVIEIKDNLSISITLK